jgi:hypothetical protein
VRGVRCLLGRCDSRNGVLASNRPSVERVMRRCPLDVINTIRYDTVQAQGSSLHVREARGARAFIFELMLGRSPRPTASATANFALISHALAAALTALVSSGKKCFASALSQVTS